MSASSRQSDHDPRPEPFSTTLLGQEKGATARVDRTGAGLERLLQAHGEEFNRLFPGGDGGSPRLFFSPGRVNLGGAHLDYNGGPVLPMTIDRGTFFAVRKRPGSGVRLASTMDPARFEGELHDLPATRLGCWYDYPLGVIVNLTKRLREPGAQGESCGLDILFGGNLAVGAGLSSSASICVGTATAMDVLWDMRLQVMDRVRAALDAEREFVGVHCGIMDPFAIGLARRGQLLWLDCKDESWEYVPFDAKRYAIGVADTGIRRKLAASEFNRRVQECGAAFQALRPFFPEASCLRDVPLEVLAAHGHELDPILRKRARHVLEEVERAFIAREALLRGDIESMARGMTVTHESLREHFEVSCPELDTLVAAVDATEGALGSRLTGAGFGGCVVMILENSARDHVRESLQRTFEREYGTTPQVDFFAGDNGPREFLLDRAS